MTEFYLLWRQAAFIIACSVCESSLHNPVAVQGKHILIEGDFLFKIPHLHPEYGVILFQFGSNEFKSGSRSNIVNGVKFEFGTDRTS